MLSLSPSYLCSWAVSFHPASVAPRLSAFRHTTRLRSWEISGATFPSRFFLGLHPSRHSTLSADAKAELSVISEENREKRCLVQWDGTLPVPKMWGWDLQLPSGVQSQMAGGEQVQMPSGALPLLAVSHSHTVLSPVPGLDTQEMLLLSNNVLKRS